MESKRILLAGSHGGSTAVALVDGIKDRHLNWEIHWVGMKYQGLQNNGVINHTLESGKVENKFTKNTIPALLKVPLGFFKSFFLINKIKPDLILTFGSASGAFASFWGWVLKIPVIVHEQTTSAGRANLFSAKFAKIVALSREESKKYFVKQKTVVTGNLINKEIVKLSNLKSRDEVKTILITGGSRGSVWINNAVKPILSTLLEKYYVIHQTGENSSNADFAISNDKYLTFKWTDPSNMAKIISKSDIVVGRSGANTVSDLIALKKPSILIPIYWSYLDEQNENAKYMKGLGLSRILPQKELTPERLLSEIEALIADYPKIIKKAETVKSPDLSAVDKLVDIIIENI